MHATGHAEPAGAAPAPRLVSFNMQEELVRRGERASEPAAIQFEVRVPGRLDDRRLRQAVRAAFQRHPMTRARLVSTSWLRCPSVWEIAEADRVPLEQALQVRHCDSDAEITDLRARYLSGYLDLRRLPVVQLLLVHRPGGDSLLLRANHAGLDGKACWRFLQSVAHAYAGRDDPVPDLDPLVARDYCRAHGPAAGPMHRARDLGSLPRAASLRPRSAAGPGSTCYGFQHVHLSGAETEALDAHRLVPEATVNDLLLAAQVLAAMRWNGSHGLGTRQLLFLMPVNLRPPEWRSQMVIHLTAGAVVRLAPAALGDAGGVMRAVVAETSRIKSTDVAEELRRQVSDRRPLMLTLPLLARFGRLTGTLSNHGRLDDPPDFGDAGVVSEFWNTAGVPMPTGLAMGAATLHNRLNLTFCYRHALFDDQAGQEFASLYLDCLRQLGGTSSPAQDWSADGDDRRPLKVLSRSAGRNKG